MLFFKTKVYKSLQILFLRHYYYYFLPNCYCNIVSIKNVNLCANLNKEPKPKHKTDEDASLGGRISTMIRVLE